MTMAMVDVRVVRMPVACFVMDMDVTMGFLTVTMSMMVIVVVSMVML